MIIKIISISCIAHNFLNISNAFLIFFFIYEPTISHLKSICAAVEREKILVFSFFTLSPHFVVVVFFVFFCLL